MNRIITNSLVYEYDPTILGKLDYQDLISKYKSLDDVDKKDPEKFPMWRIKKKDRIHVSEFTFTRNGFSDRLKKETNEKSKEQRSFVMDENMKIMDIIQYGKIMKEEDRFCLLSKNTLGNMNFMYGGRSIKCGFTYHHIKFTSRESENKTNTPSKILSSINLTATNGTPDNKQITSLYDLMGCMSITASSHNAIHKNLSNGSLSEIDMDNLPFILKNEKNYDLFLKEINQYGYNNMVSYHAFIERLK